MNKAIVFYGISIMEIITGRYIIIRAFSDLYVIKNIFFWKFYSLFMDYVLFYTKKPVIMSISKMTQIIP